MESTPTRDTHRDEYFERTKRNNEGIASGRLAWITLTCDEPANGLKAGDSVLLELSTGRRVARYIVED